MAKKIDNINESGYTEFSEASTRNNAYFYPSGRLGKFFAKFFATKALPYLGDKGTDAPLAGDTVVNKNVIKPSEPNHGFSLSKGGPVLPEVELNRKKRYKDYEEMDDYP